MATAARSRYTVAPLRGLHSLFDMSAPELDAAVTYSADAVRDFFISRFHLDPEDWLVEDLEQRLCDYFRSVHTYNPQGFKDYLEDLKRGHWSSTGAENVFLTGVSSIITSNVQWYLIRKPVFHPTIRWATVDEFAQNWRAKLSNLTNSTEQFRAPLPTLLRQYIAHNLSLSNLLLPNRTFVPYYLAFCDSFDFLDELESFCEEEIYDTDLDFLETLKNNAKKVPITGADDLHHIPFDWPDPMFLVALVDGRHTYERLFKLLDRLYNVFVRRFVDVDLCLAHMITLDPNIYFIEPTLLPPSRV